MQWQQALAAGGTAAASGAAAAGAGAAATGQRLWVACGFVLYGALQLGEAIDAAQTMSPWEPILDTATA